MQRRGGTETLNLLLTHPLSEPHSVPKETQENACLVKKNREDNIQRKKERKPNEKQNQTNNMKEEVLVLCEAFKEK